MHTDIHFLFRYWKRNKRSLLTIVLSVAFLVIMLLVTLLFERTDLRRELHEYYNTDGAFDIEYRNVDEDTLSLIHNNPTVEAVGEIYCIGKVQFGDSSATVGAFKDSVAQELAHYPLTEGRLPENSGEIVLTESLKHTFCPFAEIGDIVTLPILDWNGESFDESQYTLVGILEDTSRTTFEDPIYGYDYCDPRVLLSYEEAAGFAGGYTNVMFQFTEGARLALSDYEDPAFTQEDALRHECFERGYSLSGIGRAHGIQMVSGADSEDEISVSSKSQMIRIISVFAVIISVISLFCSISIVMKNRMDSIRLMRCIGYSKARIQRMLMLEALMLFFIGIILGTIFGILIYEGVFAVQTELFGLSSYRGYLAEWVVVERTYPPFLTAILMAGVTILLSYAVILVRLHRELGIVTTAKKKRYYRKVRSVSSAVSRTLSQGAIGVLQSIALVCVLFASTIGYLYCTQDGKGYSVVAQTTLNDYSHQENIYEVLDGVDLDALHCDCLLQVQGGLAQAAYLAPNQSNGMTQQDINALYQNGAEIVYSWSNPFLLLADIGNGENAVLASNPLDDASCELFGFESGSVSALPCILMNDTMMSELSAICDGTINPEGAVWVSVFVDGTEFAQIESLDFYSARSDETGWLPEEMVAKQMRISDCVKADSTLLEDNAFLCGVLGEYRYHPGFLIISGEYAQTIGIFNNTYDKIVLSANGDEAHLNAILSATVRSEMQLNSVTRFKLHQEYTYHLLNEYATVAFLFVFLLMIYIVGYCNVLKLRLQLKTPTLTMMRCVGLPKRKLTGYLVLDSLKIPIISTAISAGAVSVFRRILTMKYQEYCDLIIRRDAISYGKEEELQQIKSALRELRNQYMLVDEMWVPDWVLPFAVLALTVCIVSVLSIVLLQRNQITANLSDALASKDQE